jgi:hypothetical protein
MLDTFTRKRFQEADKLNPRELLLYILDLMDSGELDLDGLTVVGYKKTDTGSFSTEYFRANLDVMTELSLLEFSKSRLLRRVMG